MIGTILTWGLVVLAAAVAVVLALAAMKPDTFRVARSTSINAPPEAIFPLIENFRSFGTWSPYEKLDPAMKRTYGGPESGPGAVYAWDGSGKAGAGRMEITGTAPPNSVQIRLSFTRPFKAENDVTFSLEPRGETTNVTWAMEGPTPFVAKIMHVVLNMDRMIGKDFEAGLANLKALAER